MKTLRNNFTTPEQSKRLLELGVPADSANCYLTRFGIDEDWEVKVLNNVKYSEISISNQEYCLPCWSVGRLIEIYHICVSRGFSFNVCFPNLMNEIMYKLAEANSNGWLDLKKLEE